MTDPSNGYDRIAADYIAGRGRTVNGIGAATVRAWAQTLPAGSAILDLGCGTGIPVTKILQEAGMNLYAIDASQKMVAEFCMHFPDVPVACESVELSPFFNLNFDGIISIGLLFLLPAIAQRTLIPKMAAALNPGGKLLFTAPFQQVEWTDVMTGELSRSLGAEEYQALMRASELSIDESFTDEGGNYYFSATR